MSIKTITFIGSINNSYKRGKDKTKRKSKGLIAAGVLSAIGGTVGSSLAQSGIFVKNRIKTHLKKTSKDI